MFTTPSPIGLRRLVRQRIAHPAFHDAGEVAAWLGALQGRDYLGTKWAFGLRLPNSIEAAIVSAGRIIGTWKRALKKKAVEITLQPFRPSTPMSTTPSPKPPPAMAASSASRPS